MGSSKMIDTPINYGLALIDEAKCQVCKARAASVDAVKSGILICDQCRKDLEVKCL
jgi:ribosomal protein L37AE/L43A